MIFCRKVTKNRTLMTLIGLICTDLFWFFRISVISVLLFSDSSRLRSFLAKFLQSLLYGKRLVKLFFEIFFLTGLIKKSKVESSRQC